MDLGLSGKTAIVTGGGSNIGRTIALTLGAEGANVVIADLDEVQGAKVALEIDPSGARACCIKTDVTNLASVEEMFGQVTKRFGQTHILVNNVGWDAMKYFVETDPEYWQKIIALNFVSDLNTLKTIIPHMVENKYGRIVNIGSDAGRMGELRQSVYAGCKAGVIGLSKSISREVGKHNITLNVVCPGATLPEEGGDVGELSLWKEGSLLSSIFAPERREAAAKAYPLRRLATPEDIAGTVAFLTSDRASYITGQTVSVSGGYTMY